MDQVTYVPVIRKVPFDPNGSDELANTAAQASIGCDCLVLAHLGRSAFGDTPLQSLQRAMNPEQAAGAS